MMAAALPVEEADQVDVAAIRERMQRGLPPADVQEYLWRVRLEAQKLPDVVVSPIDPRQFDTRQTSNFPSIPELEPLENGDLGGNEEKGDWRVPGDAWKNDLLADFAELRQLMARWQERGVPEMERRTEDGPLERIKRIDVPGMKDEDGWKRFFFGRGEVEVQEEEMLQEASGRADQEAAPVCERAVEDVEMEEKEVSCSSSTQEEEKCSEVTAPTVEEGEASTLSTPLMTEDAAADTTAAAGTGTAPHLRLLLQFDQVLTRRLLVYQTEWLEATSVVSRAHAVWLYALLARLDKPVHADVAASIRQVLRRCWHLRHLLTEPEDPQLRILNILVCIAGEFFGQLPHRTD